MSPQHRPIVILGAGGYAREVLWLIRDCNEKQDTGFEPSCFIDDLSPEKWGTSLCDLPIRGWDWFETENQNLKKGAKIAAICGVGPPRAKAVLVRKAQRYPVEFVTFVHPSVRYFKPFVKFGSGCSITAGCILTTQVTIGDHVSLNLDCTVGHDAVIGSFANIAPGTHISGNVEIGTGADVGTGASILNKMKVGRFAVIGAQACVTEDVPECATSVGVPAKVIKRGEPPKEFDGL